MNKTFCFQVNNNQSRLDVFLAQQLGLSRTKTSFLILQNCVKVNQIMINKNNYILKNNDIVEVIYAETLFLKTKSDLLPYAFALPIIYEDDYLIVVNKPKNLITHPTTYDKQKTLVNALIYHLNQTQKTNQIYMVHRLDKDTTGLIVAAKDFQTLTKLQNQIKNKTMKRFYLAIVHYPFNEIMGTIDAPIGRISSNESIKFTVVNAKHPKKAITKFYVLDQNDKYALIKCELLTGRTHQIRVHMHFIEHFILNDPLYGLKGQAVDSTTNQYLHAYQLELLHPITEKKLFFECPVDHVFKQKLNELNLNINKSINDIQYIA